MSWSELPSETLALVMAKVPLTCRLGTSTCCALVSTQFLQAAVSATTSIVLDEGQCADTDNLLLWLNNRGQGVEQLRITGAPGSITSIPCPKLSDILLGDSTVDLGPGSQLFQDLTAATQITSMAFKKVVFEDEPELIELFKALPDLQHLELEQLQITGSLLPGYSARFLSRYGNLHNSNRRFTDKSVRLLSQLHKLKFLSMHSVRDITAAGVEALCSWPALTGIKLQGLTCSIDSTTVPSISRWTSLKELCVSCVGNTPAPVVDLDILADMTQLTSLNLHQVNVEQGIAGAEKMLSVLGSLGKLQNLVMLQINQPMTWDQPVDSGLWQCSPRSFAALTASSKLKTLMLNFDDTRHIGTSTAWEHMFDAGRRLSELTRLQIDGAFDCTAADVEHIAGCCPGLRQLLLRPNPTCTQLAALSSLSSLSSLSVSDASDSMTSSLAHLSCLSKLEHICIKGGSGSSAGDLVDAGLRQLTALRQLSSLDVSAAHLGKSALRYSGRFKLKVSPQGLKSYMMRNKARHGSPPDVWSQLSACFK